MSSHLLSPQQVPVRHVADRKLYLPYSSFRTLSLQNRQSYDRFTIHWFRVDRTEPIGQYANLILKYSALEEAARIRAEQMVDEFFREDEFHLLNAYLREKHHEDLRTSMLMAPVSAIKPDLSTRLDALRPFRQWEPEHCEDVILYRMEEETGYNLPFPVWGAYAAPNTTSPGHETHASESED